MLQFVWRVRRALMLAYNCVAVCLTWEESFNVSVHLCVTACLTWEASIIATSLTSHAHFQPMESSLLNRSSSMKPCSLPIEQWWKRASQVQCHREWLRCINLTALSSRGWVDKAAQLWPGDPVGVGDPVRYPGLLQLSFTAASPCLVITDITVSRWWH